MYHVFVTIPPTLKIEIEEFGQERGPQNILFALFHVETEAVFMTGRFEVYYKWACTRLRLCCDLSSAILCDSNIQNLIQSED